MKNKIVKEQDGYWFYDETIGDYEGPFDTYSEAETANSAHTKWSAKESRETIRKMRLWDE